MAPVKGPKKPMKAMEKTKEKGITKSKTSKKKNYQRFRIYLYKLLRTVVKENIGISKKTMIIMDNFVDDMLEKIAVEAGRLCAHTKKTTLTSREILAAVKLLIPGELATHSNIEAMKAINMFHKSHENDNIK